MSGASVFSYQRGIQAALSPLMGSYSSGRLRATATGGPVYLQAGEVAVPVSDGDFAEHAAVFVTRNRDTKDGSWLVEPGGTLVSVESIQGGAIGNHADGAEFRWFPEVAGVEVTATAEGPISGGAPKGVFGELQSLRLVKMMAPEDWKTFLRAGIGAFPAAALVWESLAPADGANFSPGERTARVGTRGIRYNHVWALYLVSSRMDSATHRSAESMILLQNVVEELQGKQSGRGLRVSTNPGIQIISANTRGATPSSFIDVVRFQSSVIGEDKTSSVANPWLSTRLLVMTDESNDPRPPLENPDIKIDMTKSPDGEDASGSVFDGTFSGEFG